MMYLPFAQSPPTGDHRNIVLYIIVAIISAIVMVILGLKGRRKW